LPALEDQYQQDPSVFDTIEENKECIDESTASVKRISQIRKRAISKRHDTYYSSNHDVIIATYKITENKMILKGFDKKSFAENSVIKIASDKKYYSNYSNSYALQCLKTYLELDYIKKYGSSGRSILNSDLKEFVDAVGSGEKSFDEIFESSQSFRGPINKESYMNGNDAELLKTAGNGDSLSKTAWPQWADDAVSYVADVAEDTWDGAVELAGPATDFISDAYDITTEGLGTVWDGISTAACKLWEWIKDASAATWAFLTGGVIAIIKLIMKYGAKVLPFLGLIFSVGAIVDGVYYGWKALQDDVSPLASKAGISLSGMKVLKYNETAEECGSKFQESSDEPSRQLVLAKYAKGLRDLQHNMYQVILNTVQAVLDIIFIVLELAGLLTAGVVTAVAVCIDIFTSIIIMGIETGIKDRLSSAYDTVLQIAFANASRKWASSMSTSEGAPVLSNIRLTDQEMEARRTQDNASDSSALEDMISAGLPPLKPAATSNVIPLPISQNVPVQTPVGEAGGGLKLVASRNVKHTDKIISS